MGKPLAEAAERKIKGGGQDERSGQCQGSQITTYRMWRYKTHGRGKHRNKKKTVGGMYEAQRHVTLLDLRVPGAGDCPVEVGPVADEAARARVSAVKVDAGRGWMSC